MQFQYLNSAFVAILLLLPVTEQQFAIITRGSEDAVFVVAVLLMSVILIDSFVIPKLSKKPKDSCPPYYLENGDRCYGFIRDTKSWTDAKAYCAANNADLVSIETEEEDRRISEMLQQLDHDRDIVFSTPDYYSHFLFGLDKYGIIFDGDWISFYAMGSDNAHIILKEEKGDTSKMYDVGFGTYGNKQVGIYKGSVTEDNRKAHVSVSGLMDTSEFRAFWVRYKDGHIQAGKGLEKGKGLLLEWTDTDASPFTINYIAVSSWKAELQWKFNNGRQYWTSGSSDSDGGYYFWGSRKSAQVAGYTNWKESEPSHASTESRCLALDRSWGNGGKWKDEICECKLSFICERGLE